MNKIIQHKPLPIFSGAKANSFFLYPSTKGKTENAIKDLEFSGRTTVYRPGLLITENNTRDGDSRLLEKWGQCIAQKLDTSSKHSISVSLLAKAMVANAMDKTKDKKFDVLENVDIIQIANAPAT